LAIKEINELCLAVQVVFTMLAGSPHPLAMEGRRFGMDVR